MNQCMGCQAGWPLHRAHHDVLGGYPSEVAGDIDTIRKMERERMAIMQAFTQGYIAGRFPEGGSDEELLDALSDAGAAYKRVILSKRGPA